MNPKRPEPHVDMPLITIAIPTYNRIDTLTETLDELARQEGFHDADLEIVVSDNASPVDPTPMLHEFERRHGRPLVLHRNTRNEGIDGNIHRVGELATGRYILFMSDDDVLMPGTLRHLQALVREQPDLLFCFVNGFSFRGVYDPSYRATPIIKLDRTLVTRSNDALLDTIGVWSTFLSAFFVERQAWIGVPDRERHLGTDIYLTHVLLRLLSAQPERTKIVTADALIAARDAFTGSYRMFYAFGLHFMRLLLEQAPGLGFSATTIRAVKHRTMRDTLPSMILSVRMGSKPRALTLCECRQLLRYTWWEPIAWTRLLPLILLPQAGLNALRQLRRRMRGRTAVTGPI